jgi:Putative transposase of IS4/5 family (DUF4096)
MWKPEHRRAAERNCLRYPSDLSDAEWAIAGPMIPPARHGGRKRSVNLREILNSIFYVHAMGPGRHIGTHPSCALCGGTRTGRAGGEPNYGDYR